MSVEEEWNKLTKGLGEFFGLDAGDKIKTEETNIENYISQLAALGYTPEQIQQTAMENLDPRTRDVQMQALDRLVGISEAGGLTAQDKARRMQIEQDIAQKNRSAQQAIQQNQAMRGVGGQGAELAQSMLAQQGAASQRAMTGTQTAADAEARALQALQGSANLGASIRGQDAKVASARDTINRFNVENTNAAKRYNLENQRDVYNTRLGLANQNIQNQKGRQVNLNNAIGGLFGNVASGVMSPTMPWWMKKKDEEDSTTAPKKN